VLSIMIVSDDATIWSVTYDRHYNDCNSFIIQATVCSKLERSSLKIYLPESNICEQGIG